MKIKDLVVCSFCGLSLALISCGGNQPTFGEEVSGIGNQWKVGDAQVKKGKKLIKSGEKMQKKGRNAVSEGEKLIRDGRAAMEAAEREIKRTQTVVR